MLKDYEGYIRKAMEEVRKKYEDVRFLVFSDDIHWCRNSEMFKNDCEFFIRKSLNENPMIDLHLMSSCSHHIISNSSFSWWAAWLASGQKKTVIAPTKWIFGIDSRGAGIVPDEWITIVS
jgi:hypothetical protein